MMIKQEFEAKFLSQLNEQQQEAVKTVDGAVLLLAVPGSGKTTVLVTRLGYMVCCCGIAPSSILTMTYTVAATKEMQQRFGSMFGGEYADSAEFRTINGLSAKIIEYYSRNFGKRQPFELLDNDGEASRMIGQIYQKINNEYATESTIKDIRTAITYIKNIMLDKDGIDRLDVGVQQMPEIYRQYCDELKRKGCMDYDDQMSYALTILNSYPAVLEYFQDKYRYFCVDESQDTSKIQHVIIRLLARKYGNIFMVGDEDQSIYGFRAAYPDALMSFEQDYPGAKVLFIEQNYRSTDEIVAAANAFVLKNRFRHEKKMIPTRGGGEQIQVIDVVDRAAQYKYLFCVAQNCKSETAVLFRNNDSALPLIDMFERSGVAYNCRRFDGVFFSHRIVSDVTDIINLAYDPRDADAFMRIYYKLGCRMNKQAAVLACEQSERTGRPILDELVGLSDVSRYVKEGAISLSAALVKITQSSAQQAVQLIWNTTGYGQYVVEHNLDSGKLITLCLLGEKEAGPKDMLRRLSELREIIGNHQNSSGNKMILSTIHSAKGLEYERVFLLDVFDGTLPANAIPDPDSQEQIKLYEEDRRLYYVSMTRAKNDLNVFNCRSSESVFTAEVLRSLPQEVVEENSVTEAFKQDLCERTYTHRDNGRGRVIAQCGFTVLVEYESGSLQMLSVPQLLQQRDPTVKYAKAQPKPKEKRSENKKQQRAVIHVQDEGELLAQATVGRMIKHIKFGSGKITQSSGRYVTIHFENVPGEKKFDFIIAVTNGILSL